MTEDLVDRIYEAAFVPDLWPDVFDRLSELSNSAGGGMGLFDDRLDPMLIASDLVRPILEGISAEGGVKSSSVSQLLLTLPPPSEFVYDADYFPRRRSRTIGRGSTGRCHWESVAKSVRSYPCLQAKFCCLRWSVG